MSYLTSLLILAPSLLLYSCGFHDLKSFAQSNIFQSITSSPIATVPAKRLLGEGYANRFFYQPKKTSIISPATFGLKFEQHHFSSQDGTLLHAWFIPSPGGTKSSTHTIVYHHGNYGSIGDHLSRITWLCKLGINVLIYDYRGYGKSSGSPTLKGTVEDAAAAIEYVLALPKVKHTKISSYGHSLGGAKSIAALSSMHIKTRFHLTIIESSFASYKDMAMQFGGLFAASLTSDRYAPVKLIGKINHPILLIHGTADTLIPIDQAQMLKYSSPHTTELWQVNGGNHYDCLRKNNGLFAKKLGARFEQNQIAPQ